MTIQQLESFIHVAENLNFARAAQALNITQSAVSRQVHALEQELDTKLFYRTTRTVSLTPEGTLFLGHAKQILGQLRLAQAQLHHHSGARIRTLTLGCESQTDLDVLCRVLRVCRTQLEDFHPLPVLNPRRTLHSLFSRGELEVLFGFREILPAGGELMFRELGQVPLCCALPAEHPLAGRAQVEEDELRGLPLVMCDPYAIPVRAAQVQSRLVRQVAPALVHTGENPQTALTLVRAGYGCAILPAPALDDPALVYLPLAGAPPLPYGLVYRRSDSNPLLRQFVELTQRTCRWTLPARPGEGAPIAKGRPPGVK